MFEDIPGPYPVACFHASHVVDEDSLDISVWYRPYTDKFHWHISQTKLRGTEKTMEAAKLAAMTALVEVLTGWTERAKTALAGLTDVSR